MASARRIARNARRFCLCVLAALTCPSCASLGQSSKSDVREIEIPLIARPIAWIDNENLLMEEYTGRTATRHNGAPVRVYHLISYNYMTRAHVDYGRVGTQICYTDGYISYGMEADDEDKQVIAVYGELGKETKKRIKRGEIVFDTGSRGSCRPWSERPPRPSWAKTDSAIWFLWPRLGVIDCQTRQVSPLTNHVKARFHRRGEEQSVELPFSCEEVSGYDRLRYYQFKGAYFALEYDYRHSWPENRDRRAFWLYPDGHVETLTFPYSQAIRNYAIPVRDGILAFSRPATRQDDYWVYYLTPSSTKRLYRGSASGITSPDGCKVAMLIDPDFEAKVRSRDAKTPVLLKVLDFCESKR